MAVMVDTQLSNFPFQLGGDSMVAIDETFAQDAARTTALAYGTLLSKTSAGKWGALTDVSKVVQTPASATCGANGGNLAAYQAVSDAEFAITINGTLTNFTGIVFSSSVGLEDIPETLNYYLAGKLIAEYDQTNDTFKFLSAGEGVGQSLSVLSAVVGGAGTDISGAAFLNGLAATLVAGTGDVMPGIPAGISARALTAAQIVAADVTDFPVINFGRGLILDQDQVTLENSLALTDIVYANNKNKSIREVMNEIGITFKDTLSVDEYENS
jgi:hypothetical protein